MILIISAEQDDHTQAVLRRLKQMRASATVLDLAHFPQQTQLAINFGAQDGSHESIFSNYDGDLSFSECRAVWWRRPRPFLLHPEILDAASRSFAYTECSAAISGLWLALDAFWVNHPMREEEALRRSEEQLRLALEATEDGLWDWDVPKGELRTSVRWSSMLGYQPTELPSTISEWESVCHPEDLPKVHQRLSAHLFGLATSYDFEHRLRHKAGHWVWVRARAKVVSREPDGWPKRIVGTNVDISEQKRVEAELRYEQLLGQRLRRLTQDDPQLQLVTAEAQLEQAHEEIHKRSEAMRTLIRQTDDDLDRLELQIEQAFNPFWGPLLKAAAENSRFGQQVEDFACVYTSRVSNFLQYAPFQHFRSPRDHLPHERVY